MLEREPQTTPDPPPLDLDRRARVHDAVVGFYREVVFDEVLGPVFDEIAEVDWAIHIPVLVDYWCRVLLGEPSGGGAILAPHARLHGLEPLTREMFDRWFLLWSTTIDGSWTGPYAERAKSHAARMAATLSRRISSVEWSPPLNAGAQGAG
jgi:hemoglobin